MIEQYCTSMDKSMAQSERKVMSTTLQDQQSVKKTPVAQVKHARDYAMQLCDNIVNVMWMTGQQNGPLEHNDVA
jgi:hypothetical protein